MCHHDTHCPDAHDRRCCQAHVVADHTEQGWTKLCNGVIVFTDGFYLTPEGQIGQVPQLVA